MSCINSSTMQCIFQKKGIDYLQLLSGTGMLPSAQRCCLIIKVKAHTICNGRYLGILG